jgi:hypothetical protein
MKKPQPIHSILEQTLKGLDLDGPMRSYSVWGAWKEIVGEPVALQTQPRSIRNRILLIDVSHSTWMQQLQFLKPALLEKINAFLGKPLIEDIRFRLGKITPPPPPSPSEEPKLKEGGLDQATIKRIERLVENMTDAEVKKGFRELLIKSAKLEQSRKKSA